MIFNVVIISVCIYFFELSLEIANLQENRKEAILAMNSIDFNDTDTVKELGNGDGGIMEQGNAEIIHMNSSADGAYDSEENSSDLLQSTGHYFSICNRNYDVQVLLICDY